jgi:two-component system, sensor histidine kinase YesM
MFKIKKDFSLMKKLLKYFLVLIIIMTSLCFYLIKSFTRYYNDISTQLNKLLSIISVSTSINDINASMKNYISSSSLPYLDDYNKGYFKINEKLSIIYKYDYGESYYKIKDISNMIKSMDELNRNIMKKNNTIDSIYIKKLLDESDRIKAYTQDEIKGLLFSELVKSNVVTQNFNIRFEKQKKYTYTMILAIILLCLIFAIKFSRKIAAPIHNLAAKMKIISNGKFEKIENIGEDYDEAKILIQSFNDMSFELITLIEKIKDNAEIEKKLKEQEIKNLEIAKLLNQQELNFLQSQINPHFIFNTLNTTIALSDIEEAVNTKRVLEALSEILRYNFKKCNTIISIYEELNLIKNYLFIQKMRFGEKLKCKFNIADSVINYQIPSMIIQPFVENSIVHGLEPKMGPGNIILTIREDNNNLIIIIKDDGIGIEVNKLDKIMQSAFNNENDNRSIGIQNVIRRLYLIYRMNVVDIKSCLNEGTIVSIKLPIN